MSTSAVETCFNCRRGSDTVPVLAWLYQGDRLWVCAECTPLLIHKLDQVRAALQHKPATGSHPADDDH